MTIISALRDAQTGIHRRSVEAADRDGRGNGRRAAPPLVLVAHQCVSESPR